LELPEYDSSDIEKLSTYNSVFDTNTGKIPEIIDTENTESLQEDALLEKDTNHKQKNTDSTESSGQEDNLSSNTEEVEFKGEDHESASGEGFVGKTASADIVLVKQADCPTTDFEISQDPASLVLAGDKGSLDIVEQDLTAVAYEKTKDEKEQMKDHKFSEVSTQKEIGNDETDVAVKQCKKTFS
jgi:hypothetical protein